ncbi:MAG: glycosyltransferase family 4 protein [Bacteroidales bacterium]
MKILQLCHKTPYPPIDGGSIAMHQITQGMLNLGHQVKVVALDQAANGQARQQLPDDYLQATGFEAQQIDTRVKVLPAFLNLFSGKSYNVQRFYNRLMERRLEQILQQQSFDIIQLEGLYLTPYLAVIRRNSVAPVLYRSHNIEHFIWERMATASNSLLKKQYLKLLAARLKRYELNVIHQVDGLVAVSPLDMQFFRQQGFQKPSIFIPVGIPLQGQPIQASDKLRPGTVYHLGSMDWRPNQEGVEWFLDKVWPRVIRHNPSLKFYLAGKNMPARFYRYASPSVEVLGEVPDAPAFFRPLEMMVVPLLSGGGMRVKIIEGMAAGKTIVSTSIGAEGIGCEDEVNILLADMPMQMADRIVRYLDDRAAAERIGENGRKFVKEHYDTETIMKSLNDFYKGF